MQKSMMNSSIPRWISAHRYRVRHQLIIRMMQMKMAFFKFPNRTRFEGIVPSFSSNREKALKWYPAIILTAIKADAR